MLKEKSAYKEDLPVNVTVANVVDYPIHFHNDLEVVYVLDGSVRMKNGYYNYILKQGDIFILNAREIHSFESNGEKNMVMMLQLDTDYFSRYYENLRNSFFVTDMEDDSDESLDVLRTLLARIMMEILEKGYGYEAKVIESTHNLLSNLFADFQYYLMEDGKFVNGTKNKGNKILAGRLSRITDYMYENYTRKLTLNEIAEREHLSIYYLSHVIKEATGLSFQELLACEKEFIHRWIADPASVKMPRGESLAELQDRVWPTVEKIIAGGRNALIVAHNFIIAAILCRIRDISLSEFRSTCVDTASRTVIRFRDGRANIEVMNDRSHLTAHDL